MVHDEKYEKTRQLLISHAIVSINKILVDETIKKNGADFIWNTTNKAFNPIHWIYRDKSETIFFTGKPEKPTENDMLLTTSNIIEKSYDNKQ